MSKEIKIKKENNSNDAPPPIPKCAEQKNNEIKEYFIICPECSSSIEIILINEQINVIGFRCIKENKNYIMPIKEYLEKIKEYKDKNINDNYIHNNNLHNYYFYEFHIYLLNHLYFSLYILLFFLNILLLA